MQDPQKVHSKRNTTIIRITKTQNMEKENGATIRIRLDFPGLFLKSIYRKEK